MSSPGTSNNSCEQSRLCKISSLSATRSGAMLTFDVVFVKENDSEFRLGNLVGQFKIISL